MPQFPVMSPDQAAAYNNFLLARRGPIFPTVQQSPMAGLATLQSAPRMPAAMVRDEFEEAEATAAAIPPIVDPTLSDTELAKAQMSGGAGPLFDTARARITPQGTMDYGGVKPIRGGQEELFSNPKFANLLRRDPKRAAQAYKAITGRDLGNDFQERSKLDLARRKDISDTLRSQIIRGEMRQNPETGFVERRVTIPDPNNPMQKVDSWETMDTEAQIAHSQNWETANGAKMARPNPIAALQIPPAAKATVMAKYIAKVKAGGLTPAQALEEAIKETPSGTTEVTAPSSQAAMSPTAAKANPPPKDPVAYQAWATQQAQEQNANIYQSVNAPAEAINSGLINAMTPGEGMRQFYNSTAVGIPNLINRGAMLFGMKPPIPWQRPLTAEELAAQNAKPLPGAGAPPLPDDYWLNHPGGLLGP